MLGLYELTPELMSGVSEQPPWSGEGRPEPVPVPWGAGCHWVCSTGGMPSMGCHVLPQPPAAGVVAAAIAQLTNSRQAPAGTGWKRQPRSGPVR